MTEMRQENGQVRITKGCKQKTACDQHVTFDYDSCVDNPMARLCFECCDTDFCNSNMYLPPLYENNPCGVTKIRPFLNFDSPQYADEMWAGIALRKKRSLGGNDQNETAEGNFVKSENFKKAQILKSSNFEKAEHVENPAEKIKKLRTITSPLTFTSMPTVNLKLAGGREVIPGSWSWVVQIKRDVYEGESVDEEFICAGTLIHKNWVLTAAQCIHMHVSPFDFYEVEEIYAERFER